mmetsp:Transcript_61400/g.143640  ORF Transcript_61400/g.143640 Transcript_61400/m.143640 type:complete len:404 (-) Transcript_61400:131-1342(-)
MGVWQSVASPGSGVHAVPADPDILISGAGIAGLALASKLEQSGFKSVWILEADDCLESRAQGYSLTIQQPGQKALKSLGLLDAMRNCSKFGGGGQHFVNALDGSIIRHVGVRPGPGPGPPKRNSRRNLYVPRQTLRSLLARSLTSTKILFSERVESFQESDGGVTVESSSGRKLSSALLVGCDGVNSAVRKLKLSDNLRFLGVGMINGIASSSPAFCDAGSLHLLDGTRRLFMKPFEATGAMWQLTFPAELGQIEAIRALPKQELQALAESETSSWCPEFQAIIRQTDSSTIRAGALFDRDPLCCAAHVGARTAVIGDAAHPMTPFIGQGANQAMTDSIQLAESLSSCRDESGRLDASLLGPVLASFHQSMAGRVAPHVLESRRRAHFCHTPGALGKKNITSY